MTGRDPAEVLDELRRYLRRTRQYHRVGAEQVAQRMGISVSELQALENGDSAEVGVLLLAAWADALQLTLDIVVTPDRGQEHFVLNLPAPGRRTLLGE